ncbi:hypothetical protein ACSZOO_13010, partial [Aeromonas hydrophila]
MLRHRGHQIAAAHQRQRGGKAGYQGGDGARQSQLGQRLIDRLWAGLRGQARGFYRDAGLDVTLRPAVTGTNVVNEVMSGNA